MAKRWHRYGAVKVDETPTAINYCFVPPVKVGGDSPNKAFKVGGGRVYVLRDGPVPPRSESQ